MIYGMCILQAAAAQLEETAAQLEAEQAARAQVRARVRVRVRVRARVRVRVSTPPRNSSRPHALR
jgi:hypothetical protein